MFTVKNKQTQWSCSTRGFTLLEILVALFIFSILSLLLASGLRTVINAQTVTEQNAERLRSLQMALLIMSRDIEQTVNRPIKAANGTEERSFVGTPTRFSFTHMGIANPTGTLQHSALQRVRYFYSENGLWRMIWPVADQAPQTVGLARQLQSNVQEAHFQYLDKNNHFQNNWPVEGGDPRGMPRAVKVFLTLSHWGKITQIYILPMQEISAKTNAQPTSLSNGCCVALHY